MSEVVMMTKSDQKIYTYASDVLYGKLSIKEFSILIDKSYRQAQRIVKKVKEQGMFGVKHGNIGKRPWNKHSDQFKRHVLDIYLKKYLDFNLTHFREILEEKYGVEVKAETLRKWAHETGHVKNKRRRSKNRVHKLRPRMPQAGQLVQFDGSEHAWFGPKSNIYTLIGGMDDATGEILYLEFFAGEDTFNCMKAMKKIIQNKGIPHAFYLDRAGHFGKPYSDQNRTQIGRALEEVDCKVILASTPQAKGRIERLWRTLQDRLIAELKYSKITTVRSANRYLWDVFIPKFNKRFTVPARSSMSAYRAVDRGVDLERVFCIKEQRRLGGGNIFSFNGHRYQLEWPADMRFRFIDILCFENGNIEFELLGRSVTACKLEEKLNNVEEIKKVA